MQMSEVADFVGGLEGVRRTTSGDLVRWRYHGRLIARQLDDAHLVIRADFDYRDTLLQQFPSTFDVPGRFASHMMVVADLGAADPVAVEDALVAAWALQRAAD